MSAGTEDLAVAKPQEPVAVPAKRGLPTHRPAQPGVPSTAASHASAELGEMLDAEVSDELDKRRQAELERLGRLAGKD